MYGLIVLRRLDSAKVFSGEGKTISRVLVRNLAVIGLILLLFACSSGGGDDATSNPTPFDDDQVDDDIADDDTGSTTTTVTTTTSTTASTTTTTTQTTTTSTTTFPFLDDMGYPMDEGQWIDGVFYQQVIGGSPGYYGTDMAIDANDTVYVMAEKGAIIYLYKKIGDEPWTREKTVVRGWRPKFDMDVDGNIYMAYADVVDDTLHFATNKSGKWFSETVDGDWQVYDVPYLDIAVDSTGVAHIAYAGYKDDGVWYATNKSGHWEYDHMAVYPNMWCYDVSIKIDSSDHVHIVASQTGYMYYINNTSGEWTVLNLGSGVGPSLALDNEDHVHVAFMEWINSFWTAASYITNQSGDWSYRIVDLGGDPGWFIQLVIDDNDKLYMSHFACDSPHVRLTSNRTGVWKTDGVPYGEGDPYNYSYMDGSLAIDNDKRPHLAGYDDYSASLFYGHEAKSGYTTEVVDKDGGAGLVQNMTISQNNEVAISSYRWGPPSDHKGCGFVAKQYLDGWIFYQVDPLTETAMYNAVAIDNSGKLNVAYFREIDFLYDLYYASNRSGEWEYTFIDHDISPQEPRILAVNDGVYILYVGGQDNKIRMANNLEGDWAIESLGIVGENLGPLLIDDSGKLHTCANGEGGVNYISNIDGEWNVLFADGGDIWSCGIELDSNDSIHLVYRTAEESKSMTPGSLKYANNISGEWVMETILDHDTIGGIANIGISDGNMVNILYGMRFFTNKSGIWESRNLLWSTNSNMTIRANNIAQNNFYIRGSIWYARFTVNDLQY